MKGFSAVVYDIEIKKAIQSRNETRVQNIEYCAGWHDHAGMGISVIGAYDYLEGRYRVFCQDNFADFAKLITERKVGITFNGLSFDNKVIEAHVPNCKFTEDENDYDILVEMWKAADLGPKFVYPTHAGFSLDATAKANFGMAKTGEGGGMAPINWQRGNIGTVIDYCLNDVLLTKTCFDLIRLTGSLRDPRGANHFLSMRKPPL